MKRLSGSSKITLKTYPKDFVNEHKNKLFFSTGEMSVVKICKIEHASLSLPEQGNGIWEAQ